MNIYQKLNKVRIDLQEKKLQKSGVNKFAGYNYYELGDFLPTINKLFDSVGLCAIISFGVDIAVMEIVDTDKPEDKIIISSPMADAELKGCHPIQNLGATETYTRRYLYMTALEIVEQDALDGSEPILKTTKPAVKGTATSTTINNPDVSAQATQLYWCFVGDKPGQLQMSKEEYNALTKELAAKKIISNSYSKEWTQSDVDEVRKIYNEKAGITEDTEEEEVLPF